MEPFTLDPRRWLIARVISSNPLLRRCDRVEALVSLIAIGVLLVAIPLAGVAGWYVYNARGDQYAREALSRHPVTATVVDVGTPAADSGAVIAAVKWTAPAGERTDPIWFHNPVRPGERVEIWVDTANNPTAPPMPAAQAIADAIGVGLVILSATAIAMAYLVARTHSHAERAREVRWERAIRLLQSDGGRTNRP